MEYQQYLSETTQVDDKNLQLSDRITVLDAENAALQRSLYALSTRFSSTFGLTSPMCSPEPKHVKTISTFNPAFTGIQVLKSHRSSVSVCKFSNNGAMLASGSLDNTVHIWKTRPSASDPVQIDTTPRIIAGHDLRITDVCWNPDDTRILSVALDTFAILWDVETAAMTTSFPCVNGVSCVAIPETMPEIVVIGMSNGLISGFDLRQSSSKPGFQFDQGAPVSSILSTSDSGTIYAGDKSGLLCQWDISQGSSCINQLDVGAPISDFSMTIPYRTLAVNCHNDSLYMYSLSSVQPYELTQSAQTHTVFDSADSL